MKPARFEFIQPKTVDDVAAFKAAYEGEASVIAGGQSLVPMLNFRLARPAALINLGSVTGLDRITVTGDTITVGAMTRQSALEHHEAAQKACPLLGQALQYVAHPVIRNRGTVGKTIAHADASAEMPTVLTTLDGRVRVHGTGGTRVVEASDLFEFHLTTSLELDEVLTEVEFPVLPARTGSAFQEYARRHGDYAIAGICAVVTLAENGTIAQARIGGSGIAPTPVRARDAEAALVGATPSADAFAQAGELAAGYVDAIDEEQASVAYRKRLVRTLTARALDEAVQRARATIEEG